MWVSTALFENTFNELVLPNKHVQRRSAGACRRNKHSQSDTALGVFSGLDHHGPRKKGRARAHNETDALPAAAFPQSPPLPARSIRDTSWTRCCGFGCSFLLVSQQGWCGCSHSGFWKLAVPHHARSIPEPRRPLHAHFVSAQHATLLKMPPKGKKGQDKGKSTEEERDEPLQAVVRSVMHLRCKQC
jgi:hypothetical protein